MLTTSRFLCGAVLGLLCFAPPALSAQAAESASSEIVLSPSLPVNKALSLQDALAFATPTHPELSAYALESRAREADLSQVVRLNNPELSVEVANIAGSGALRGFDAAETTVQLSQELVWGGKRHLRRTLAEGERDRAESDLEFATLEMQARISRDFWRMLSAQERLKLAEEEIALTTATLAVVDEQIAVGKAPAVTRYRFQSALAAANLNWTKADFVLATTRRMLAAALGQEDATLERVRGDLTVLPLLPAFDQVGQEVGRSPDLARRQQESDARRRALSLARAERFLDPTLSVGLRNFQESDDSAFLVGFSVPLPLFDRNQGNVKAAAHRLAAAQAQEATVLLQSRALLAASWQLLAESCSEAQALRDQFLPLAQRNFDAASFGYQSGKFGVLEMHDTQRTLIELRTRTLEVLTAAQLAKVELERLLGNSFLATVN